MAGAVRLCYELMYSLFLGFGLAIGAELFHTIVPGALYCIWRLRQIHSDLYLSGERGRRAGVETDLWNIDLITADCV